MQVQQKHQFQQQQDQQQQRPQNFGQGRYDFNDEDRIRQGHLKKITHSNLTMIDIKYRQFHQEEGLFVNEDLDSGLTSRRQIQSPEIDLEDDSPWELEPAQG